MWHLYDANSIIRSQFEVGRTARAFYEEVQSRVGTVFVIWDGPGGLKQRRQIYPDYKAHRGAVRTEVYDHFDKVSSLLEHSQAIQITVPGYEADDVIATLSGLADDPVRIYTRDRDLLLLEGPRVKVSATPKEGVLAEDIRHYKTLVGDPADNIPGLPGFGHGGWVKADRSILRSWIDEGFPGVVKGLPRSSLRWLEETEGARERLGIYWDLIGFIPVEPDLIIRNFKAGSNNRNGVKENVW